MTTRQLFIVTALSEVGLGLLLVSVPSMPVLLLIGASLDTPGALVVARVAGAALLSIGAACWLARDDGQSRAAKGLVAALLLYNAVVVALVLSASFGSLGALLFALAVLHGAMAMWCIWLLRGLRMARGAHDGKSA